MDNTLPRHAAHGEDWVCSNCGDSFRCSSCTERRPARTAEDRAGVASALERQAAERQAVQRRTPEPPSVVRDAIQILVTGAILLAHLAVVGLSGYGIWYEVTNWDGGVAFAYVIAAIVGAYGTWRSAEALLNGTWQAVRLLTVTGSALAVLVFLLPFLTWSRSGP